MAARLTVVMIETPPPAANAGRLAEDIVGHVIGRPGIDLTLVRSLAKMDAHSTDQLTLDAITGDIAVLDWQSPDATISELNAAGFVGQRAPHRGDPTVAPAAPTSRRIYAFNLTQFTDAGEVLEALERLKSEREVRTFSLGSTLPRPTPVQPIASLGPTATPPTETEQASQSQASDKADIHSPAEIDLDDLIDQLDRSDT